MLKVYVQTDEKFQDIINISTVQQGGTHVKAALDNPTIDISKLCGYKLVLDEDNNYHLVFDQDKYASIIKQQQKEKDIENGIKAMEKLSNQNVLMTASDEDAYTMRYLYPTWDKNGVKYKKDERVIYEDKFYKVLSDHTSQESWTPNTASSLFVEISDPSEEYPQWRQPTSAVDAYMKGDKVTFNGKKYISSIDNNTWSPNEYSQGWQLVE